MDYFELYIYSIIAIKIGFILCVLTHTYLKYKGQENSDLDKKVKYWKERFHFIFEIQMAAFLIYLFNQRDPRPVSVEGETKLLLYLFGFVLIITAHWSVFIEEAKWFDDK